MDSVSNEADTVSEDIEVMKKELTEFGFKDENMCKEEMSDLLKALRFSKTSAIEEDDKRATSDVIFNKMSSGAANPTRSLPRRFRNVSDRRLPWCLLPPNLTVAQKVKCLSAYLKLVAVNQYMRARGLSKFETWPTPINITSGVSTRSMSTRATRSGRTVPSYAFVDEDSNELDDFVPKKPKKRKTSNSESISDGVYTNKTFSLKRKAKTEGPKNEKEVKPDESNVVCLLNADSSTKMDDQDEESTSNICKLIDSICNSNDNASKVNDAVSNSSEDVSTSKDPQKTTKTRLRKQ